LLKSAAAHRRHGHDDDALIAATTNISRFSSVRGRVGKANGMTVIMIQAIELSIYTLRTLRSDDSAGYIALVCTSDNSARDTDGDDLRSAGIVLDGDDDFFTMSYPTDVLIEYAHAAGTPPLECIRRICVPDLTVLQGPLRDCAHHTYSHEPAQARRTLQEAHTCSCQVSKKIGVNDKKAHDLKMTGGRRGRG
jgi:hypothetical protein